MGHLLSIVTSLPENSTLIVMGVGLIASALVLRRLVAAFRSSFGSNSEHAAKTNSIPSGTLRPSERPDQVASV